MAKVSDDVRAYLKQRQLIKELLPLGVFNYTGLARFAAKEIYGKMQNVNAIKAALLRQAESEKIKSTYLDEGIGQVLSSSRIEIRSAVSVFEASREVPENVPTISQSNNSGSYMAVVDSVDARKIRLRKGEKLQGNYDLIVLKSPPTLETTPGVIALILNVLAREGINVVEFISCINDTLLVVNKRDTQRAFELLRSLVG
ncbi:hypothetical protein FJZ26_05390 [Candidatus Parvarchaeota archaeon]|nr:hypothetical protein [Candidatus Parvarchaeota archaeon]